MKAFSLLISSLLLGSSLAANAKDILACTNNQNPKVLILSDKTDGDRVTYSLQLYDRVWLMDDASLTVGQEQFRSGAALMTVDHFESRVGELQLVVAFDVGGAKSKHVYFDASFRQNSNNAGGFGLQELEAAAKAGYKWTCER